MHIGVYVGIILVATGLFMLGHAIGQRKYKELMRDIAGTLWLERLGEGTNIQKIVFESRKEKWTYDWHDYVLLRVENRIVRYVDKEVESDV